jgi:hypothetical protein
MLPNFRAQKYSRKGSKNMKINQKSQLTSPGQTPCYFTYKGAGGGIWSPSGLVITWAFKVWRYRCYSIFAAFLPFSFLSTVVRRRFD